MTIMRKITGLLQITAFCCVFALSSAAQDKSPYEDTYIDFERDGTAWAEVGVSLQRDPSLPPENFVLNLSDAGRYDTGCPPFRNVTFETEYKNDALDVRLTGLAVDNSEFPYYKCNGKANQTNVNVVLNKNDLIEKEIKKIRIVNGGLIKTYAVELTNEKIDLGIEKNCKKKSLNDNSCTENNVKSIRMQNVSNVKNPLRLWFYPDGTLMLYTPGSKAKPEEIKKKIQAFAADMGLTPIEDIYAEFDPPLIRDDHFYFVDKTGQHGVDDGGVLGNISVERMAYGLHGDEAVTEQVTVHARKPGAYD